MRSNDRVDDRDEVAGDEDVGQCVEEGAKRAIVAGRVREFLGANLVGSASDWNGADRGEIRLVVRYGSLGAVAGV